MKNLKTSAYLSLLVFLASTNVKLTRANDKAFTGLYKLSNDMMGVVTEGEDFAKKRKFNLTTEEADLVKEVAINDLMIGDYIANNKLVSKDEEELIKECMKRKMSELDKKKIAELDSEYQKRKFLVGAYSMYSTKEFEKDAQVNYKKSEYHGYLSQLGKPISGFNSFAFDSVVTKSGVKESDSLDEKIEKMQKFLKDKGQIDLPAGLLASEFAKKDIIKNPLKWEDTLKSASRHMTFDQKVNLVASMGEKLGNDYNYNRINGGPDSEGYVKIETLLTNLSNNKSGGVCRDISVAQTQMLKAMGVKDAYSVAYLSNRGGHATVIARDPNDKNKIMKLNYGELYEDDGKKGTAVLDQDSSLPSVGMQYRIYDSNGKPIASVPTELTQVLHDVVGKNNPFAPKSHTLYKVDFGTDAIKGNLFSGRTSKGEEIKGFALSGESKSGGLSAKYGAGAFNSKAEKTNYDLDSTGGFLMGDFSYSHKVFETKKFSAEGGLGVEVEVMMLTTESTRKGGSSSEKSEMLADKNIKPYFTSQVDYDISKDAKVEFGAKAISRIDKANVADEGSYGLHYDSTIFSSKYYQDINKDMKFAVETGVNVSKYGESAAITSSLVDGKTKYYVGGNLPLSDAPSFFSDQQKFAKAGVSSESKNGWQLSLEYEKNFDSGNNFFGAKVHKKF